MERRVGTERSLNAMDYFLQSELQQLARSLQTFDEAAALVQLQAIAAQIRQQHPLPEFLTVQAGNQTPSAIFDIFLSYSSKDAPAVLGLYHWLSGRNYCVYLDCFDPSLPNPSVVNRSTAEVLRRRMVQSRSLFVATTKSTPSSAWVPWELGFTDGFSNKAAVLFIAPGGGVKFHRQSYFELYPEVQHDASKTKPDDLIITDSVTSPPLSCSWGAWLRLPKRY